MLEFTFLTELERTIARMATPAKEMEMSERNW